MELLKGINQHYINNFRKFVSLTQKQMPGRIADALLYLVEDVYKTNPVKLTISRQDLADLTAMSKESAIRILKQFKMEKIINSDKTTLEVIDMEQLKRISELG